MTRQRISSPFSSIFFLQSDAASGLISTPSSFARGALSASRIISVPPPQPRSKMRAAFPAEAKSESKMLSVLTRNTPGASKNRGPPGYRASAPRFGVCLSPLKAALPFPNKSARIHHPRPQGTVPLSRKGQFPSPARRAENAAANIKMIKDSRKAPGKGRRLFWFGDLLLLDRTGGASASAGAAAKAGVLIDDIDAVALGDRVGRAGARAGTAANAAALDNKCHFSFLHIDLDES